MEITLKQAIESEAALAELSLAKGLPQNISFRLGTRVIKPIRAALIVYGEKQNELLESYGECKEPDPTKRQPQDYFINTKSPGWRLFNNYRDQLLAEKISLNLDDPIKASELGNANLQPAVFADLDWLIVE